jgi:hypothetical protein
VKLWDRGTHMTKQEWARTCRRVENRLNNLKTNSEIGTLKTPKKRQGALN